MKAVKPKEALKALSSGTYDQLTGRDPKYKTSGEQTLANTQSLVPALDGIYGNVSSNTPAWESSFGKRGVDTVGARKKYEQRIGHVTDDVAARNLRNRGYSGSYTDFDFDNIDAIEKEALGTAYKRREDARRANATRETDLLGFLRREQEESDDETRRYFANKYGASFNDVMDAYGRYLEKQKRQQREDHPWIEAVKDIPSAFERGISSAAGWAAHTAFPYSDLDKWLNNENIQKKVQEVEKERNYSRNSTKIGDTEKKILEGAYQAGDLISSSLVGGALGGGFGVVNPETGYALAVEPAKWVGQAAKAVPAYGLGAESKYQQLKKQGVDEDKARQLANISGLMTGAQAGFMPIGQTKEGISVGAKILLDTAKQSGIAMGREIADETAEQLVLENQSTLNATKQAYMAQGQSDSEATKNAWKDLIGRVLAAGGEGALWGGVTSAVGNLALPKLSSNVSPSEDLNSVWATQPALEQNNIPRLTGTVENPQALPGSGTLPALPDNIYPIQMPGTNGVINLPGQTAPIQLPDLAATSAPARTMNLAATPSTIRSSAVSLAELNSKKAAIEKSIRAHENNISIYQQDQWRGQVKKASQKKIRQANREIAELKQELKSINRQIKGEPTPVIEQLDKGDQTSFKNYKTALKKLGEQYGGQDGKDIAESAAQLLDNYIETGDKESLRGFARDMFQIHLMAAGDPEYDFNYGTQDGIFGATFGKSRVHDALENVRKFHENKPAVASESAPDVPHQLASRYAQAYQNFDAYDYMDNAFENDGFIEQMADDIANGRDLTQYISRLSEDLEEAPDVQTRDNMQALINELTEINPAKQSAPVEAPFRSYKDLLPDNPFWEADNYKTLDANRKDVETRIQNLNVSKDELYNLLKKEELGVKTPDEMTSAEKISSMFFKDAPAKKYTDEGRRIEKAIADIDNEIRELNNRSTEIYTGQSMIKNSARNAQVQNYRYSDPIPVKDAQNNYPGFDITVGTNTDVQRALDNGTAYIAEMSPLEYLQRSAYDIDEKATLESVIESANSIDKVRQYAEAMRRGDKFPVPNLTYGARTQRGQEGRTRALAAYEAGIDRIPVAIVGKPSANEYNATFDTPTSSPISEEDLNKAVVESMENTPAVTFQSEQAKIDKFLDSKKPGSIEMESGQIFEHYSLKDMKTALQDIKDMGYCDEDFQCEIRYKNGDIVVYGAGDDTSNMKLSNIDTAIFRNPNTDAFYGNNARIYTYDTDESPEDALWTMDIYDGSEVPTIEVEPQVPEVTNNTVKLTRDKNGDYHYKQYRIEKVGKNKPYNLYDESDPKRALQQIGNPRTLEEAKQTIADLEKQASTPMVPEVTQAPAPAQKEVPFVYNNFPDSEVPYTKEPEMDEYMLQNHVEPMKEAARNTSEPPYDPALDEEMRTNYLDPMKEEWNRDALDNLNMEEDIPAQAPDNGYWLRVLGDEEFAVQEAAKQGVDVDDLRKAAAYNTGYDLPKSSDNVPPTNNPPGGNEPPEDEPKMRERGMSKHMRGEGKMQMEGVPDEVKEDFINDPDMYKVLSNKSTQEKADYIYNNADDVEAAFRDLLIKKDPAALPLGHQIAKDYSAAGNYDMAAQIYRDMGEKLTEAGQFSQAAVLAMMREDPMTALHYAQKELSKLNAEGKSRFGDKWKPFELTEDEIDAFNHINPGDKEAIQKVYDQIGQRIGKEYPTTFMEKLLEGRKIAMLFNPRTVMRNFLANPPTLAMRWISDRIEALGQAAVCLFDPSFERTQAITGSGIQGRRLAKKYLNSEAGQRLINGTTGKYEVPDIKGAFTKDKQMYKGTAVSKWIDQMTDGGIQRLNETLFDKHGVQSSAETIRNLTYGLLELGDNPFVKENFIERLGSYIHVQGIKNVEDIPEAAVELAWSEAMKATYKDNSWAVNLLNKTKKGMESVPVIGRPLSQATIPFVQAPGNISARMVDYSAIRGTKGIADVISGANKGDQDKVRRGIEEMAKGLTGMLGIAAGMALYKSGIITGDYAEKAKQKAFQQLDGFKSWAIRVPTPWGTAYGKYDWAQPGAEQLIIGTLLAQAIENSDQYDSDILRYFGIEGSKAGKVIGALGHGAKASVNSWFDQSSLQGLMDLMKGNSGQSTDMAQNIVDVGVSDFAGALVPSVGNATAKTLDTTARQTTDPSNTFASFLNQQKAKIPEVSKTLPAKYDVWGEEVKYARNKAEAFLQRFVVPGEYGFESSDPTNKELKRLLETTGDEKVFPFYAAKTVGDKTLNNEEVSAYQKDMGQRSKKLVDAFLASDRYKSMSDEDRVASLYNLYQTSKIITERELFDKPVANTSTWKKYVEAYDKAGGGEKGIDAVVNFSETKASMKSAGLTAGSNLGKSVEAAAASGDMKKVEQITSAAQSVEDLGFTKVNPKETYIKAKSIDPNLSLEEFGRTYRAIDGADGSDPNQGIRQKEVIDYLNQNEVPYVKGVQIYDMYAPAGKKKAAQKDDGTWYLK